MALTPTVTQLNTELDRLQQIHSFRPLTLPTCLAWCAASPTARLVSEFVSAEQLTEDGEGALKGEDEVDSEDHETTHRSSAFSLPQMPLTSDQTLYASGETGCSFGFLDTLPSPLPSEADYSDYRGTSCAGMSVARSIWMVTVANRERPLGATASVDEEELLLGDLPPQLPPVGTPLAPTADSSLPASPVGTRNHTAARASQQVEYVTLTLHAHCTPEHVRTLLEASAWWFTRASLARLRGSSFVPVPVFVSVHGTAAWAGFLACVAAFSPRTASRDARGARSRPLVSSSTRRSVEQASIDYMALFFDACLTSLRLDDISGPALCCSTLPDVPVAGDHPSSATDPHTMMLAQLPHVCPNLRCLRMRRCDDWLPSWWGALLWYVLPTLSEVSLSDLDTSPHMVPTVLALLRQTPPSCVQSSVSARVVDGETQGSGSPRSQPAPWALRALQLRDIREVSCLSFILLAHLFLYKDVDTTRASWADCCQVGCGRFRSLEHLVIENVDLRPLHIEDEARCWCASAAHNDETEESDEYGRSEAARSADEQSDGARAEADEDSAEAAYQQTLSTIRAAVSAALPHASRVRTLDLLVSCPALRTCRIWNVTSQPIVDPTTLDCEGQQQDTDDTVRGSPDLDHTLCPEPSLRSLTFMYSSFYPLSALTAPRPPTPPSTSSMEVVETVDTDTGSASDATSAFTFASLTSRSISHADEAGGSAWAALSGLRSLLFDTYLSPAKTFARLEEIHVDSLCPCAPRVYKGYTHLAHTTFWRRLARAVSAHTALCRLRRLEITLYVDDTSMIPVEMLQVSPDGQPEHPEVAARAESEAASFVASLSWLAASAASLESIQLMHVIPLASPDLTAAALARVLTTFPKLHNIEFRWTSETIRGAVRAARPLPVAERAWCLAAVRRLVLLDADEGAALRWHTARGHPDPVDAGCLPLSSLASLRSVRIHCSLLAPPTSSPASPSTAEVRSTEPTVVAVDSDQDNDTADALSPARLRGRGVPLPSIVTPFQNLVTLSLTGFAPAYAALLLAVPCYPQLQRVDVVFARMTHHAMTRGSSLPYVHSLLWLTHAPRVSSIDLSGCDVDPKLLISTASQCAASTLLASSSLYVDESAMSVESWWDVFLAPVLSRPHLAHVEVYGFTHLTHMPEVPAARVSESESHPTA